MSKRSVTIYLIMHHVHAVKKFVDDMSFFHKKIKIIKLSVKDKVLKFYS